MKYFLVCVALLAMGAQAGESHTTKPKSGVPSTAMHTAASAGSEAAAVVNAAVESRNHAVATGGDASAMGGDASIRSAIQAAQDASNRLDLSLRESFNNAFNAALSNNSRSELNLMGAKLGGDSTALSSVGPVSAGGATVSNSVYTLTIPAISAQAPGLPSVVGDMKFLMSKQCDRPYDYVAVDQLIIHTRTFMDRDVREPTALYTVRLDTNGQAIQKPYRVLMNAPDRKARIVECEFTRQVLAMENAAGTHGFSISIGSREGVGAGGNSGGATRSFPTAKYLMPEKGMKRQCLVHSEWVDEGFVGKSCRDDLVDVVEQRPYQQNPPVIDADAIAAAIVSKLEARVELTTPTYERRWKPCPPKGCKTPKGGYYEYIRKSDSVKAQVDFGTTHKATTHQKNP